MTWLVKAAQSVAPAVAIVVLAAIGGRFVVARIVDGGPTVAIRVGFVGRLLTGVERGDRTSPRVFYRFIRMALGSAALRGGVVVAWRPGHSSGAATPRHVRMTRKPGPAPLRSPMAWPAIILCTTSLCFSLWVTQSQTTAQGFLARYGLALGNCHDCRSDHHSARADLALQTMARRSDVGVSRAFGSGEGGNRETRCQQFGRASEGSHNRCSSLVRVSVSE